MAEFIDKLHKSKHIILLDKMKMRAKEDVIGGTATSCHNGKFCVVHGKNGKGKYIESIYTDYYIELLYGYTPSKYDQIHYQDIMTELCGAEYAKKVKAFNRKNGNDFENFTQKGIFIEDEESEEEV